MNQNELNKIKEQIAQVSSEIEAIIASVKEGNEIKRSLTEDEFSAIDQKKAAKAELEAKAKTIEQLLSLENSDKNSVLSASSSTYIPTTSKKVITRSDKELAISAYILKNSQDFTPEMGRAAEKCDFNFEAKVLSIKRPSDEVFQEIKRSSAGQSIASAGSGGYSLPDEVGFIYHRAVDSIWNWKDYCSVHRTDSDADLPVLTLDDTAVKSGYTVELTGAAVVTDVAFSPKTLKSYYLTSAIGPVSYQLLRSSRLGLLQEFFTLLGERQARKISDEVTNGTGPTDSHYSGILLGSVLGATATGATYFEAKNVLDLYWSVSTVYRNKSYFMGNSATLAALNQLTDTNGNRLVSTMPILSEGPKYFILDRPYIVNESMPSIGANKKFLLFGDFSYHKVKEIDNVTFRQTDSIDWLKNVHHYAVQSGGDSLLVNPGNNPVKHLVAAATDPTPPTPPEGT